MTKRSELTDTAEISNRNKNTPEIQQPKDSWITEPLPESSRPRKDGPGGDGDD